MILLNISIIMLNFYLITELIIITQKGQRKYEQFHFSYCFCTLSSILHNYSNISTISVYLLFGKCHFYLLSNDQEHMINIYYRQLIFVDYDYNYFMDHFIFF